MLLQAHNDLDAATAVSRCSLQVGAHQRLSSEEQARVE